MILSVNAVGRCVLQTVPAADKQSQHERVKNKQNKTNTLGEKGITNKEKKAEQ